MNTKELVCQTCGLRRGRYTECLCDTIKRIARNTERIVFIGLIELTILSCLLVGMSAGIINHYRSVEQDAISERLICSSDVIDCPGEQYAKNGSANAVSEINAIYGVASFYDYELDSGWSSKGHRVCAMRDVPRGTMVKVTDLSTGRSTKCLTTDYGPEKEIFPDRVIDLSSTAFSDIKPLKYGIIQHVAIQVID